MNITIGKSETVFIIRFHKLGYDHDDGKSPVRDVELYFAICIRRRIR